MRAVKSEVRGKAEKEYALRNFTALKSYGVLINNLKGNINTKTADRKNTVAGSKNTDKQNSEYKNTDTQNS